MSKVSIDIKALLEAGAHFGHKTSRWHPKMAPYIHSEKGGSHIIDLNQTVAQLDLALDAVVDAASRGKQVLLVGTKRQAAPIIREAAKNSKMPYVTERWLGGMLTNFKTMTDRIKHLKKLEERMESGELANNYNKLEVQRFSEEIERLNHIFGGIRDMSGLPGVVFVTDIKIDKLAVKEARRSGVKVVAIVDSNNDPSEVDIAIPANDDAIRSIQLITNYITEAIAEGKAAPKPVAKVEKAEKKPAQAADDQSKSSKKVEKPKAKPAKTDAKATKPKVTKPKTKPAAKSTAKKAPAKPATKKTTKTTKKAPAKKSAKKEK